ncbi:hypothetical protein [Azoarcus sp. KH32C]|uniref:hypothetical protein n=1 Tax=Azoarcus sp. KH32C TaxID=748247 RepID=UPI0002386D95|nr:hypothetical protein [Azoarcus sp. KH32C]BAL24400.1 hypothetical protein AZKH_2087 [Azoarcus sp. KH32C]
MDLPALRRRLFAAALVALPAVHAQEPPQPRPKMAFDCWISAEQRDAPIHYIACIRDRGDEPPIDETVDPPELIALDEAHRLLHEGRLEDLDRFVSQHAPALSNGKMWKIRIFSYPTEWSWDEERPQLLVRMLCPEGYDCPVFIRR